MPNVLSRQGPATPALDLLTPYWEALVQISVETPRLRRVTPAIGGVDLLVNDRRHAVPVWAWLEPESPLSVAVRGDHDAPGCRRFAVADKQLGPSTEARLSPECQGDREQALPRTLTRAPESTRAKEHLREGQRRAPMRILLVEDNDGDVRLMQEMLKALALPTQLDVVPNGEAALAFLRHEGRYADAPRPDIMLLDLYLPRKTGVEVLADLRRDPSLHSISVVVCLSSESERALLEPYHLPGECVFLKGYRPDHLGQVITRCLARAAGHKERE